MPIPFCGSENEKENLCPEKAMGALKILTLGLNLQGLSLEIGFQHWRATGDEKHLMGKGTRPTTENSKKGEGKKKGPVSQPPSGDK